MTRYFITGAQGFVGRYLAAHLLARPDAWVVGVGRSAGQTHSFTHSIHLGAHRVDAPLPANIREALRSSRYSYVSLDLFHHDELVQQLKSYQPDVIFHMASGLRDDDPVSLYRTNVEGTSRLMGAIRDSCVPVQKVILGSTGGVYGSSPDVPFREDSPCNPIDPYSTSKLISEQIQGFLGDVPRGGGQVENKYSSINGFRGKSVDVPTTCPLFGRMFNLVGPGQDERHICGRLASQVAGIERGWGEPEISVGTLTTTRDFIDVRDVATALVCLADRGAPGTAYNIASGIETSMQAVLDTILGKARTDGIRIVKGNYRQADIPRHVASIQRLASLGFQRRYTLAESLEDVLNYYREAPAAIATGCSSTTRPSNS